ncbi:MAG TPA: hypothetical protein VIY48_21700 [Candidatus Paceibacterota bacterium]
MTIPPEIRKLYQDCRQVSWQSWQKHPALCDAIECVVAQALQMEWVNGHSSMNCYGLARIGETPDPLICKDKHHQWTPADWLAEAKRRLSEPVEEKDNAR